ncbi:MAG: hypothetical protein QXH99_05130 [Sulfolobales archaeon]
MSRESVVSELMKEFEGSVLPKLNTIVEDTKRYLYFIAWLNTFIEGRGLGRVVITGGFAVEVYTGRVYRTMDVDVVVEGCGDVVEGFIRRFSEKIGRGYLPTYEVLSLKSIDIVSTIYTRRKEPTKLYVDDLYVYIEPVEDLITTYLSGWKYWGSTEDRDKVVWLLITWRDRLDWDYLNSICVEKGVMDKLKELMELISTSLT